MASNAPNINELDWNEVLPSQVNEGDYVVIVDNGGTGNSVIGVVHEPPFTADPLDPDCRKLLFLIRIRPQDRGLRLVSTDRPVQVLRLPNRVDKGNFTASDGFEANI